MYDCTFKLAYSCKRLRACLRNRMEAGGRFVGENSRRLSSSASACMQFLLVLRQKLQSRLSVIAPPPTVVVKAAKERQDDIQSRFNFFRVCINARQLEFDSFEGSIRASSPFHARRKMLHFLLIFLVFYERRSACEGLAQVFIFCTSGAGARLASVSLCGLFGLVLVHALTSFDMKADGNFLIGCKTNRPTIDASFSEKPAPPESSKAAN